MGEPKERNVGYQPTLPGMDAITKALDAFHASVATEQSAQETLESRRAWMRPVQHAALKEYDERVLGPRRAIWADTTGLLLQHEPTTMRCWDDRSGYRYYKGILEWTIPRVVHSQGYDSRVTTTVSTGVLLLGTPSDDGETAPLRSAMRYLSEGKTVFDRRRVPDQLLDTPAADWWYKRHIPEDPLKKRIAEEALRVTNSLEIKVQAELLGQDKNTEELPDFPNFTVLRPGYILPWYLDRKHLDDLYETVKKGWPENPGVEKERKPIPNPTAVDIQRFLRETSLHEKPISRDFEQLAAVNALLDETHLVVQPNPLGQTP